MCRSKELGGRRCPSHSDPVKHAAYNERRRELYALKKATNTVPQDSMFPPLSEPRVIPSRETLLAFTREAHQFRDIVNPSFSEDTWEDFVYNSRGAYKKTARASFLYYTDENYDRVHRYLKGEESYGSDADKEILPHVVKHMDKALAKAPAAPHARVVYRGIELPGGLSSEAKQEYVSKHFPVGGVVSQKTYMSTSLDIRVALSFSSANLDTEGKNSVVFEILTKKGAALGRGVSSYDDDEREIMMPRDERFKVVGVHHGVNISSDFPEKYINNPSIDKTTVIQLVDVVDDSSE